MSIEPRSRAYPDRPLVGVGAVIWVDGKVVLIRRRHEPLVGQWSIPGGTLKVGETLAAGVAREVLEETSLEVEVGPVIDVFDRIVRDEDGRVRFHFVLVDYLCRPTGGRLRAASDALDVVLADPRALDKYELAPETVEVISYAADMAKEDT